MPNKQSQAPQYFITQDESAQYFEVGYSCDNAILLRLGNEKIFITDARYTTEARENLAQGVELVQSNALLESAIKILANSAIKSLSFDSTQLSVSAFDKLKSVLKIELKAAPNFHQALRIHKSDKEIALIKESQRLNKQAYKTFARLVDEILKGNNEAYKTLFFKNKNGTNNNPTITERELFALAKIVLAHSGEYDLSFAPIIAINENAAKPHALPSQKELQNGDLLLFDAGIKYKRYCSDMTRTARIDFAQEAGTNLTKDALNGFSKTQVFKDRKLQKIYDTVKKAQEFCIENLRAGMSGKQIDALARRVIEKEGFGEYFSHSTGHGIGLDIHEQPFISARSETIIEDGAVFSVEPGIYIPQYYGVRIEDLVVVKNGRAEVL